MAIAEVWPEREAELARVQIELAAAAKLAASWSLPVGRAVAAAGAFIAYRRGVYGAGAAGDRGWAAAAEFEGERRIAVARLAERVGSPYIAGYLALREGPLLERIVRALIPPPEVVLLDSTGLDHPRRAGMARQLGAVLDLPTVGVTDRPLIGRVSGEVGYERGERAPLMIADELVGYALRTQRGVKPVLVHAGWRTDPEVACEVVLATTRRVRTPEPLREARRLAKAYRARETAVEELTAGATRPITPAKSSETR